MIGVSIARSTRSGSGVGPGICRKWRPTGRHDVFDALLPAHDGCGLGRSIARLDKTRTMAQTVVPGLERRLKAHLLGEVEFDAFTRGRYATDASHYQIMPLGVVAPRSVKEAQHALAIAREEGVSVLARGAGTSQAGPG